MPDPTTEPTCPALRALQARATTVDGRRGLVLTDPVGIAEPAFVPAELVAVLARFDGASSAASIAAAAAAELGQTVTSGLVEQIARDLDARLLLQSARYRQARDAALGRLLDGGTRACRHAGSAGYPNQADLLGQALRDMVPAAADQGPALRGLIAPHIDLARGHRGYAAAYGRLLAAEPADLHVVFGTGHQGPTAPVTGLPLDWQTPLGTAATDREFVASVHAALGEPSPEDLLLHRDEHSLEFQVLLLQHLARRRGTATARVACFLCGQLPVSGGDSTQQAELRDIIAAFQGAAAATGQRVCYVAGADLAHLGPFFGDPAAVDADLLERLDRDDRQLLAKLEGGEPGAFHGAVEGPGNPDRVCSAPAMTLASMLAGGRGELLHYGQAAAADGSQVVSFCAMAFADRD